MPESDALHKLSTNWAEIAAAHTGGPAAREAQVAVLRRYCGAIYHWLVAATGDPHTARALAREFALRFVRGDFHRLDPGRGRFRDFVRTVLHHLVADHYRRLKTAPGPLPIGAGPVQEPLLDAEGISFANRWRDEMLDRAW